MKNPFENPRKIIKNVILTTTLAAGMLGGIPDAKAGNGGGSKAGIETLKQEHLMHSVDAKQLKKVLSEYETSPGSVPLDMFLSVHKDQLFTVTEAVGQTSTAASLSAEQKLRAEGKVSSKSFAKNLGNGNVSVILIAIEK